MYEFISDLQTLFEEILEEFGKHNTENRLLTEFGISKIPTARKVVWEIYDYDVEVVEEDNWTYHFVIQAKRIPESLKTGTANTEWGAVKLARDNLKAWFRQEE
jgi:uncharacterized FlgJ-related protein